MHASISRPLAIIHFLGRVSRDSVAFFTRDTWRRRYHPRVNAGSDVKHFNTGRKDESWRTKGSVEFIPPPHPTPPHLTTYCRRNTFITKLVTWRNKGARRLMNLRRRGKNNVEKRGISSWPGIIIPLTNLRRVTRGKLSRKYGKIRYGMKCFGKLVLGENWMK